MLLSRSGSTPTNAARSPPNPWMSALIALTPTEVTASTIASNSTRARRAAYLPTVKTAETLRFSTLLVKVDKKTKSTAF